MSRTRRSLRRFLLLRCASDDSFSTSPAIFSLDSLSVIKPSTRHGARHGRYTVPASALLVMKFLLRPLALLLWRYRIDHNSSLSSFTFALQSVFLSCFFQASLLFCTITLEGGKQNGLEDLPCDRSCRYVKQHPPPTHGARLDRPGAAKLLRL